MRKKFNNKRVADAKIEDKNRRTKGNKRCESRDSARSGRRDDFNEGDTSNHYRSAQNDVNWYVARPNMLTDVARVPMNVATGVPLNIPGHKGSIATTYTLPGVATLTWYPTVGLSMDTSSPINVVARSLFSYIRHVNSGTINYEQSDVVMYLMAIDSIYTVFQSCVRMYGLSMLSNPYNRYWMDTYALAAGANPDDLRKYRDIYLGRINGLAAKISNLFCPNTFPFITRHIWLSSGVYLDRDSARAQAYLFRVGGYLKYDPKHANGGAMIMHDIKATTLGEWLDVLEDMLGAVITDSDFSKISGDVLAAYGVQNMMRIATVDRDYVVVPTFQPEVLTQIQNTMWLDPDDTLKWATEEGQTAAIWQKDNVVYSMPNVATNKSSPRMSMLLMPMDEPTPADVMVATRNMIYLEEDEAASNVYYVHSGSEIFTGLYVFASLDTTDPVLLQISKYNEAKGSGASFPTYNILTNFNMHPSIYVDTSIGNSTSFIMAEINNAVVLPDATLEGMHINALLSEFNIATIGLV